MKNAQLRTFSHPPVWWHRRYTALFYILKQMSGCLDFCSAVLTTLSRSSKVHNGHFVVLVLYMIALH